jgi:2Fe-2S ferredoxin
LAEVPKVTYLHPDGTAEAVNAAVGSSVMHAAITHDVNGIVAECGGNLLCATCHVYVDRNWLDRLPAKEHAEEELLKDTACACAPNSRLSCQIVLNPGLDGIVVTLPQRQT